MKTIGIIGISGGFGSLLRKQLEGQGYVVVGCDENSSQEMPGIIERSDIVIFAVPIHATQDVIHAAIPHSHQKQLWMDVTSLKREPLKAMLQSKAWVIGTHPLFRPGEGGFHGQTVAICPGRDDKNNSQQQFTENLFQQLGAQTVLIDADRHDKAMSYIQQLTHFALLTWGSTLTDDEHLRDLSKLSTPVFEGVLSYLDNMLLQDPGLYFDIQKYNPYTMENIEHFIQHAHKLKNAIESNDRETFNELFRTLRT
ncbi:MAG TPA: prephenate dehydrogenase/arogenate dehydrogenase family protein [Candidatus Saccharimonadales bacterium]|nr:prephenate dehydrogenase/arogenate dehydrogenase family protein [Candidatus Saccharimonadales bacterium]